MDSKVVKTFVIVFALSVMTSLIFFESNIRALFSSSKSTFGHGREYQELDSDAYGDEEVKKENSSNKNSGKTIKQKNPQIFSGSKSRIGHVKVEDNTKKTKESKEEKERILFSGSKSGIGHVEIEKPEKKEEKNKKENKK